MYVQRLLQICIATLTVLGPLLLGADDRFPTLPLWVFLAAVASLWVTDATGWLCLNRMLTNVAAVGAVLLSLGELSHFRGGVDILSVAKLLVYLQVILLFQRKEFRTYWQLAALSLLQVIVAAAFNQSSSFGLLLVVYLFVGISALSLFFLYRERVLADGPGRGEERKTGEKGEEETRKQGQSFSPHPSPLAPHPSSLAPRWPLMGQEPEFVGSGRAGSSGLGREFWLRLVKMTLGSLLLTGVIFTAVPRLGSGVWYGTGLSLQRMVGFSDVVTLGALGTVIENPQEVLVVEFRDNGAGAPYRVTGGVYLRGALLSYYSNGTWDSRGQLGFHGGRAELTPVGPPTSDKLVRQEITIQPMDRDELFCVWPVVAVRPDPRVQVDVWRQRLLRTRQAHTRFSYQLGTTAFEDHLQVPIVPAEGPFDPQDLLGMPPLGSTMGVPELVRVAGQWLRESKLPQDDRVRRARWLEHMFHDSGQFEYSLQSQVRQPDVDPIEDFIKNNRRGHCEYFATALVLMLRSQGIPARAVVGFKTNEWNELGQFYQVRQLHAHTWVEAYLEPQHIPPDLLHADRPWQWSDGAWLRLDPTPAARDLGLEGAISFWNRLDSYFTWLDYVWTSYVMDMDRPRQEKAIYNPVIAGIRGAWRKLTDSRWWSQLYRKLAGPLRDRRFWYAEGSWFSWSGLLAATAAMGALALTCTAARRLWRRMRTGATRAGPRPGRRRVQIEFYRRLEVVLGRFGLVRAASQTQREFAHSARSAMESTGDSQLALLPAEVVEAFYRVRFGGQALDKGRAEAVERALEQLAEAAAVKGSHEDRVGRVSGVG